MVAGDLTRATQEALHEREVTTAALVQIAPVGIMRFDALGRCNYVNQRWTEWTGLTIDEAIGEGWLRAVHHDDRRLVIQHWRATVNSGELFREEYRLLRPDGSVRWVFAEGVPLRTYAGEPLGFIRAVTDVTRHRELESELRKAREELEERVRERTKDLEAEMLQRERLEKEILEIRDNEQRRFSQDLHDDLGQYLTGILFRVLALQRRLETEQPELASNAASIGDVVNHAIKQAHDLARGITPVPVRPDGLMSALEDLVKNICASELVKCRFECDEPLYLNDNSAATHLYRITQEAVTNAIKHGNASEVVVRLERRSENWALLIKDNGDGFDPNESRTDGRGLNIMKHRARVAGAVLHVSGNAPRGTMLECLFATGSKTTAL